MKPRKKLIGVKYLCPFVERDTKSVRFILTNSKKWVEEEIIYKHRDRAILLFSDFAISLWS
jgi:hypothetical protein